MGLRAFFLLLSTVFFSASIMGCGGGGTASKPDSADDAERVVAVRADIDVVLERMEPYGDGGQLLAMLVQEGYGLKQWSIDGGVLSAVYSISTNQVVSLTFHFSDWRQPRGERKSFDFEVTSFNPESGEMVLALDTIPFDPDAHLRGSETE